MTGPSAAFFTGQLSGLAQIAASDVALTGVVTQLGAPELELVGPPAARPFLISAMAAASADPVLVVAATGREADELTAQLRDMVGKRVSNFPSWETLPHERLSPSADTVGQRLRVLHRLRHPEDSSYGPPLSVVVTTVRSLVQPMAPGLGALDAITLREGAEVDFHALIEKLVELAYARVDMVGKRGEFAVRHPGRVPDHHRLPGARGVLGR